MTNAHPFKNIVDNAIENYMTAFQWGITVLPTPKEFAKILTDQAKAYGINWEDSLVGTEGMEIVKAVAQFSSFYALILQLPLPSNPSEEYASWYSQTH